MPYCPDCGSEIDRDNVYCSNCGYQIGGDGQGASSGGGWNDESGGDWGADQGGDDWGSDSGGDSWAERSGGDGDWSESGGGGQPGNPNDPARAGGRGGQGRGRQGRGGQGRGGGWEGGQGRGGQGGGWENQGGQRQEWGDNQRPRDELFIEDGRVSYALKFPFSDGWGPIGISGFIYFLANILLFPFLFIEGYLYRVTEAAAWGDTIQPRFDEYGNMFVTGLKYFGLYLTYLLGGLILVGAPLIMGAELGLTAVGGLLAFVLGLIWAYIGPAVLTLYPVTGSFTAALSPSRIGEFALTTKYFGAFLLFIALQFAFQIVFFIALFALLITVIGLLLLIPLLFIVTPYILYFTGAYWGATYYEAAQERLVEPAWDEEPQGQQETYGGEPDPAAEW